LANETGTYDPEKLKLDNEKAAYALASQQQQTAGQSQPYQAYDYSGVINRANQAPVQHQNYDYGKSLGYADRRMQTNNMGQATSLGDVRNQISQAANTLSQPTFQNSGLVGQLTGDILSNLNPVRQQQQNAINQQYDASRRALQESLAARGGNRGGGAVNQLMGLEQARNQQLAQANAGLVQGALAQALPFGQLALTEKGLLQGQQQTAANQLASLLGQQESSRQWSEGFNADQLQRQFANTLAAQQTQAGENQFGSQFTASEAQRQMQNIMAANALAADENRYGQQFNQQESQFGRSLGLEQQKLSQQESQFARSLGLDEQKLSQQEAQFVRSLAEQVAGREQQGQQWQQQFGHQTTMDLANLTGMYNQGYASMSDTELDTKLSGFLGNMPQDVVQQVYSDPLVDKLADSNPAVARQAKIDLANKYMGSNMARTMAGQAQDWQQNVYFPWQQTEFDKTYGLDERRLEQQGTQFDKSYGLDERRVGSDEAYKLALLAQDKDRLKYGLLANIYGNYASNTPNIAIPDGFYDLIKDYLGLPKTTPAVE